MIMRSHYSNNSALLVKTPAWWSVREQQRLRHFSNADNLTSNHIYRMDRSIFTAGNRNTSTKCRYFSDIRLRLEKRPCTLAWQGWRPVRAAQILGGVRTLLVQGAVFLTNVSLISFEQWLKCISSLLSLQLPHSQRHSRGSCGSVR